MRKTRTLTRNTFKRKIVVFGASVFASLALVATGFATWVISTSSQAGAEGNVTVGVTEDASIEIATVTLSKNEIAFEPQETDDQGRVVAGKGEDAKFENLEVTYNTTITGASNLNTLTITVNIPVGVQKAITEGYLTISYANDEDWVVTPVYAVGAAQTEENITSYNYTMSKTSLKGTTGVVDTALTYVVDGNNATLDGALSFGWGTKFGNMNPGLYYDDPATGKQVADADVKVQIDTFRALLGNLTYEQYKAQYLDVLETSPDTAVDPVNNLKFNISIEASAS